MKCNVAVWDRCLRFVIGVALTAYAIAGGPFWAYFGIYLILTAAWGFCAIYAFFNLRTLKVPWRATQPPEDQL